MAPDHVGVAREGVAASPAALEVINRLSAAHGPLMFVQFEHWGRPHLTFEVSRGAADGL